MVFAAVEDSFEGVKISLVTLEGSEPQNMQITLRGSHLSPECGQDFFRCQDILVESLNMQQQLFFIPLRGGLALVNVTVDRIRQSPLTLHTDHLILSSRDSGLECSPSAVYKILDNYFAVCSNVSTNLVSALEIRLNKSSLGNSVLVQASDITVPPFVGNVTNTSNFLHLEIDRNHEYIVVALGTAFFSLRPFDYSAEQLADVPSQFCDGVYQLVPLNSAQFYAYCTEHLYVYDIGEETWLLRDTFSRIGIPYQCPGLQTNISVFDNYIHLQYTSTIENIDIKDDFIGGVCFGNKTQNYFAFTDRSAGFFVLDLLTAELSPVSTSACREHCYPLVTVANRYLIVRDTQESKMLVLDFFGEQFVLMETLHIVAPLVTLLAFEQHDEIPITTAPTTPIVDVVPENKQRERNVGGLVAGIVVTSAVVILVVFVAIIAVFVLLNKRRCQRWVLFSFSFISIIIFTLYRKHQTSTESDQNHQKPDMCSKLQ